jgi:hypothetical protein
MDIFDTLPDKYKESINKKLSETGDTSGFSNSTAKEMDTYNIFKDFF